MVDHCDLIFESNPALLKQMDFVPGSIPKSQRHNSTYSSGRLINSLLVNCRCKQEGPVNCSR